MEEVAVGGAYVVARGNAGASAQYHLVDHKLAIVLTQRALIGLEVGVGEVGAVGPLPYIAMELVVARYGRLRVEESFFHESGSLRNSRLVVAAEYFPLKLSKESLALPAGEGIGFIKADVGHRVGGVDGAHALIGIGVPLVLLLLPIEGVLDLVVIDPSPAFAQPVAEVGVAPRFYKGNELCIAYQPVPGLKGLQVNLMTAQFIIKAEALAFVAYGVIAFRDGQPAKRAWITVFTLLCHPVSRAQGIEAQNALDVIAEEFLMLLFVLQSYFQNLLLLIAERISFEKDRHAHVYMCAVFFDLFQPGAGDEAALVALHTVTHTIIIAVEEVVPGGVEGLIVLHERDEQKLLKKPGGMGEVPLGRTHVHHGLYHGIFGFERGSKMQALFSYLVKPAGKMNVDVFLDGAGVLQEEKGLIWLEDSPFLIALKTGCLM